MNTRTTTTRSTRHIQASCQKVYAALITAEAIAQWKVPPGMKIRIHYFEGRKGGTYRISLTYDAPERAGKTSGRTDTYHGHFVQLLPNEKIVEQTQFETGDPDLKGEMTITTTLAEENGGTLLTAVHEGLPPGVKAKDNEEGWRLSLNKLAELVEKD